MAIFDAKRRLRNTLKRATYLKERINKRAVRLFNPRRVNTLFSDNIKNRTDSLNEFLNNVYRKDQRRKHLWGSYVNYYKRIDDVLRIYSDTIKEMCYMSGLDPLLMNVYIDERDIEESNEIKPKFCYGDVEDDEFRIALRETEIPKEMFGDFEIPLDPNARVDDFVIGDFYANSATAKANNIDNTPGKYEWKCICKLIKSVLIPLRHEFNEHIRVNSCYRSPALNNKVKGASKTSDHMHGAAADISSSDDSPSGNMRLYKTVLKMADAGKIKCRQIIYEFGDSKGPSWVHVSINHPKAGKKHNQRVYIPKGNTPGS